MELRSSKFGSRVEATVGVVECSCRDQSEDYGCTLY